MFVKCKEGLTGHASKTNGGPQGFKSGACDAPHQLPRCPLQLPKTLAIDLEEASENLDHLSAFSGAWQKGRSVEEALAVVLHMVVQL